MLNPNLYIQQRIQIDNRFLNQVFNPGSDPTQAGHQITIPYGSYKAAPEYYAPTQQDGIYCVLVIDYDGDTRGLPWYSHITALNVDGTASLDDAVPGGQGAGMPTAG
jgi:hypothetical protein